MMKMAQARLCVPTLEQIAAASLYETPQSYFDEVKEEYQARRDVLFEGVSAIEGVQVKKPAGAFYMMIKLPIKNAENSLTSLPDFSILDKKGERSRAYADRCTYPYDPSL